MTENIAHCQAVGQFRDPSRRELIKTVGLVGLASLTNMMTPLHGFTQEHHPTVLPKSKTPILPTPEQSRQAARYHTKIVGLVQNHLLLITKYLEPRAWLCRGQLPSGMDILNASLKVPGIDMQTREVIELLIKEYTPIVEHKAEIPADIRNLLNDFERRITGVDSIPSMLAIIQERSQWLRQNGIDGGLQAGLMIAADILHEGKSSIYGGRHGLGSIFAADAATADRNLQAFWDFVGEVGKVAKADVIGAVAGAIAGFVVGAVAGSVGGTVAAPVVGTGIGAIGVGAHGAVLGAIGGGVTNSVKEALSDAWSWLFG